VKRRLISVASDTDALQILVSIVIRCRRSRRATTSRIKFHIRDSSLRRFLLTTESDFSKLDSVKRI